MIYCISNAYLIVYYDIVYKKFLEYYLKKVILLLLLQKIL